MHFHKFKFQYGMNHCLLKKLILDARLTSKDIKQVDKRCVLTSSNKELMFDSLSCCMSRWSYHQYYTHVYAININIRNDISQSSHN